MRVAGAIFSRPWLYRLIGSLGRFALRVTPRWLKYSRGNLWGRQRELPEAPKQTFRQWYEQHRK